VEFTLDRGSTPLASTMINLFITITILTNTYVVKPIYSVVKDQPVYGALQYICNKEEKCFKFLSCSADCNVIYFCIENKKWYVDLDSKESKLKRLDVCLIRGRYLDLQIRYTKKQIKIY